MMSLLSENALIVAKKRYLRPDETPEGMFHRVAKALAKVEERYGKTQQEIDKYEEEFYGILSTLKYLPGGRTLKNAGSKTRLVNNCIVLPIEDSMDGIFSTLREACLLQQAGSGLGFNFSTLRPAGWPTKTSEGYSSGPISFLQVYNEAFKHVKQQNRNGANMAVFSVHHPDILEFISCKKEEGKIKCFNISVGLTDEFMQRVINNDSSPWMCKWKDQELLPREIIRDADGSYVEAHPITISAPELFRRMCKMAHINGEPGVFMLDEVNRFNPLPGLGRMEACNPCFHPDTLVYTEDGPISISKLNYPSKVYSMNEFGKLCLEDATPAFKTKSVSNMLKVTVYAPHTDQRFISLIVTPDHKIWSNETSEMVEAQNLNIKDNIAFFDPKKDKKVAIAIVSSKEELEGEVDVWDITVNNTHRFFANGILAANCGEVPMHNYDVCNLGSINLSKFVKDPTDEQWKSARVAEELWENDVLWTDLESTIRGAVRMQDNVIDICDHPVQKVNDMARANRRIGLGIMGYADMVQKLRVGYDSKTSCAIARKIMKYITDIGMDESKKLAQQKGSFPNISLSIYDGQDMRNSTITTIPPTGSTAMVADAESGCEPPYALAHKKTCMNKQVFNYVNKQLLTALKANGIVDSVVIEKIILNGSLKDMIEIPEHLRQIFVTSMDISPEAHVRVQAAFQENVHTSISKTINLPNKATVKDVEDAIKLGYYLKVKGMTLYRDGSRWEQILNLNTSNKKEDKCPDCSSKLIKSDGCNKCSNISCGYARCG